MTEQETLTAAGHALAEEVARLRAALTRIVEVTGDRKRSPTTRLLDITLVAGKALAAIELDKTENSNG